MGWSNDLLCWKNQARKGKKAEVVNDDTNLQLEEIDLRKSLMEFNDEKNGANDCAHNDGIDGNGSEEDNCNEFGSGGN